MAQFPALTMPSEEAERRLMERVHFARRVLLDPRFSPDMISGLENEERKWRLYNQEMLNAISRLPSFWSQITVVLFGCASPRRNLLFITGGVTPGHEAVDWLASIW